MGRVKELMMEMEELYLRGYVKPDEENKYVCLSHFTNSHLKKFIRDNSREGKCSYCNCKTKVCKFTTFMDFVGERLTDYLGPIDDEGLYLASSFLEKDEDEIPGFIRRGPYIAPKNVEYYTDIESLMDDFELITDNGKLNEDMASCFNVDYWIRKDPTALLYHEEMGYAWKNFSERVKKQRYTFFKDISYYKETVDTHGVELDVLSEVAEKVCLLEENLKAETCIYRGRPNGGGAPYKSFEELTAPPIKAAKTNRMSPAGVSMFYGAFEENTCCEEIKNYLENKETKIYVGKFRTTKDLKLINLCNIPQPNFWMKSKNDWQTFLFLKQFHDEISRPIIAGNSELNYIPSQAFSEYLRFIQRSKDGSHFDGIIYKSSLVGTDNIVLFYDDKTSANILELISVEEQICKNQTKENKESILTRWWNKIKSLVSTKKGRVKN